MWHQRCGLLLSVPEQLVIKFFSRAFKVLNAKNETFILHNTAQIAAYSSPPYVFANKRFRCRPTS